MDRAVHFRSDGLALSHAFANQLYDRIGSFYQAGVKLRLN